MLHYTQTPPIILGWNLKKLKTTVMFNTASYLLHENRAFVRSQILSSLSPEHREVWKKFREVEHYKNLSSEQSIKILSFLFVIAIYITQRKKVSFDEAQKNFQESEKLGHEQFVELSQDEKILEILHLFQINDAGWDDV